MVPGVEIGCNRELAKIIHATQACENMRITVICTNARTYACAHTGETQVQRDRQTQTDTDAWVYRHACPWALTHADMQAD